MTCFFSLLFKVCQPIRKKSPMLQLVNLLMKNNSKIIFSIGFFIFIYEIKVNFFKCIFVYGCFKQTYVMWKKTYSILFVRKLNIYRNLQNYIYRDE